MDIAIIGAGYVGLVTAACFAEMGHHVICLDINAQKVQDLQKGIVPIYEPGLKELVKRNLEDGRLCFTTDYQLAIVSSQVCFIAVATPSKPDGSCDLSYVFSAASSIASAMKRPMLVVNKSTVPVGTAGLVKQHIARILQKENKLLDFDVVSNPEFLKEGNAINDCMKPDRIIIGVESQDSARIMREIYSAFTINHDRILIMSPFSAELAKYAANAMLALRISFMNELSGLCEKTGANINDVRVAIGADQRIGYHFLYAGIGYGGSCFPKDIRALCATAEEHGLHLSLLRATEDINKQQRSLLANKITEYFSQFDGILGKKIAIWGLSFKPHTDDIREAPALFLIETLISQGANLRLFDPVAMPAMHKRLGNCNLVTFCKDEYESAQGADAIVLATEWRQFRYIDFNRIIPFLNNLAFFDGRNQYQPQEMEKLGFAYFGIGMPINNFHKPINNQQIN
jgi:UDPglucose 6-dehydrogenase